MNNQTVTHLPAGWSWSRFDEIGTVSLGRQRSPANHIGPAMRPYVRAANITWTGLDLSDVKQMNFDEADFARFRLEFGDVLINEGSGSAAEVGKPAIWRGEITDCCFQNTLLRVQPEAGSSEYVFNYIKFCAKHGKFVPSTQGVNIYHIGREGLARQPIPVPPLPEQRRIVAKIDSLSAMSKRACDRLDHVPRLVARYKEAMLRAAFRGELTRRWRDQNCVGEIRPRGDLELQKKYRDAESFIAPYELPRSWRWLRLPELGDLDRGKSRHRPRNDPKLFDGPYPFVQTGEVRAADRFLNSYSETLSEFGLSQSRLWPMGTVCITIAANIAETAILSMQSCFPDSVVGFVADTDRADSSYVEFFIRTARSDLESFAPATAQKNINLDTLSNVRLPVAPLREQREIVRRVENAFAWIDRLAGEAISGRKFIDHLDQAVLAKAFRGELVPQDPADEPASVLLKRIKAARDGTEPAVKRRGRPRQATSL